MSNFAAPLQVHRNTASKYLEVLVGMGLLSKHRVVNEKYFMNDGLVALLMNAGNLSGE